jgi:hypothetical protein
MLNYRNFNSLAIDNAGSYFISKAVDFIRDNNYLTAYHFLLEGLNIITCDCFVSKKLNVKDKNNIKFKISYENYADWGNFKNHCDNIQSTSKTDEYLFCKSFIYSFSKDIETLRFGLDAIEEYLSSRKDNFGLYIKGKILVRLEDYANGLSSFEESKDLIETNLILFKIGRLKEDIFKQDGLEELFKSFIQNPSNICSCSILSKYGAPRGLTISIDKNNIIDFEKISDYNKRYFDFFIRYFNIGLEQKVREAYYQYLHYYDSPHYYENTKSLFDEFYKAILNKRMWVFFDRYPKPEYKDYDSPHKSTKKENEFSDQDEDDYYNSNNEKYAHDEWSDDDIDDIFEGDPDNTWNVD